MMTGKPNKGRETQGRGRQTVTASFQVDHIILSNRVMGGWLSRLDLNSAGLAFQEVRLAPFIYSQSLG